MVEVPPSNNDYYYNQHLIINWTPGYTPDFENMKEVSYKGEIYLFVEYRRRFNFFPPETYELVLIKKNQDTFIIETTPDDFEYLPEFENNIIKLGDLIVNKDLNPESPIPRIGEKVSYKGTLYTVVNTTIIRRMSNTPRIDFLLRPFTEVTYE